MSDEYAYSEERKKELNETFKISESSYEVMNSSKTTMTQDTYLKVNIEYYDGDGVQLESAVKNGSIEISTEEYTVEVVKRYVVEKDENGNEVTKEVVTSSVEDDDSTMMSTNIIPSTHYFEEFLRKYFENKPIVEKQSSISITIGGTSKFEHYNLNLNYLRNLIEKTSSLELNLSNQKLYLDDKTNIELDNIIIRNASIYLTEDFNLFADESVELYMNQIYYEFNGESIRKSVNIQCPNAIEINSTVIKNDVPKFVIGATNDNIETSSLSITGMDFVNNDFKIGYRDAERMESLFKFKNLGYVTINNLNLYAKECEYNALSFDSCATVYIAISNIHFESTDRNVIRCTNVNEIKLTSVWVTVTGSALDSLYALGVSMGEDNAFGKILLNSFVTNGINLLNVYGMNIDECRMINCYSSGKGTTINTEKATISTTIIEKCAFINATSVACKAVDLRVDSSMFRDITSIALTGFLKISLDSINAYNVDSFTVIGSGDESIANRLTVSNNKFEAKTFTVSISSNYICSFNKNYFNGDSVNFNLVGNNLMGDDNVFDAASVYFSGNLTKFNSLFKDSVKNLTCNMCKLSGSLFVTKCENNTKIKVDIAQCYGALNLKCGIKNNSFDITFELCVSLNVNIEKSADDTTAQTITLNNDADTIKTLLRMSDSDVFTFVPNTTEGISNLINITNERKWRISDDSSKVAYMFV